VQLVQICKQEVLYLLTECECDKIVCLTKMSQNIKFVAIDIMFFETSNAPKRVFTFSAGLHLGPRWRNLRLCEVNKHECTMDHELSGAAA